MSDMRNASNSSSGISQTPLVPLSITPSIDNTPKSSTSTSPVNNSFSSPDILPKNNYKHSSPSSNAHNTSRAPSATRKQANRNISAQMRGSRTASLIIPVMSSPNDAPGTIMASTGSGTLDDSQSEKEDYVDLNAFPATKQSKGSFDSINDDTINNTLITPTPDSPPLPHRPPRTPTRPSNEFTPEELDTYGLQRIPGSEFSPISVKSRKSIDYSLSANNDTNEEEFGVIKDRYLIQCRKTQIEKIIELLTKSKLCVSNDVYFNKLHSSNDYIEVLSELRTGSFLTANVPILYSLLLNSLKLKEDSFQKHQDYKFDKNTNEKFDTIINGLSPLLRSTDEQKLNFKNDLMKVYSLFSTINQTEIDQFTGEPIQYPIEPNAFVAAFIYRCASRNILPQAVIVALLIDRYIIQQCETSREFHFLLLRSVEAIDTEALFKISRESNPLVYLDALLKSDKFWCDFVLLLFKNDFGKKNHQLGLTNVLHRFIIYGVNSLVDVIVELRKELGIFGYELQKFTSHTILKNTCDLVRFHREFLILNDSASAQMVSSTLDRLSLKSQDLEETLKSRQNEYNELLHNYKQLNEEKISVSQHIEKLTSENASLAAEKRSLSAQVDQALGQYDVIKQTMEKNKRVQELNDSMTKEIERLTRENQKLRA